MTTNEFDKYVVTGKTTDGKSFRICSANAHYALAINLYNGRVWAVKPDGHRRLIKHVIPG